MAVTHDPVGVRRVWERHKARIKPSRFAEPRWQKRASEHEVVGVIAQPWFNPKPLLGLAETSHSVSLNELDPKTLREEGQRLDKKLVPTDQEVMGAARLMARKGGIDRLMFVADKTSGGDMWLFENIKKLVHKPLELRYIQDLGSLEDWVVVTKPS
jgi:hypothetical protein